MLHQRTQQNNYAKILSDGTIRVEVDKDTPGAVRREYENPKTKQKGEKYEMVYDSIDGKLRKIYINEGDYGTTINLVFNETISISANTSFGKDLMCKLPNIDLNKEFAIIPYSFTDDRGNNKKGLTVVQNGKKIFNYFYDKENEKVLYGFPEPSKKKMNSDDWKEYFIQVKKFLVQYTQDNIIPKFVGDNKEELSLEDEVVTEDLNF